MRTVDVAATGRMYQDGLDVQALPRRRETLGEPSSRSTERSDDQATPWERRGRNGRIVA